MVRLHCFILAEAFLMLFLRNPRVEILGLILFGVLL